ncbi:MULTISPECIES: hypothetical protein [Chitinophagaceae]|uniref:hypothetical protein n=1 Tax=Chitinophagaceae TaxID=563835 RepID=UPI000DF0113F|nr:MULTISPECIES: hypothetical protein [Chitinophagaceae]RPD50566.1 hypothetical protein DRJ53_06475 [Paracnuella aquatica]
METFSTVLFVDQFPIGYRVQRSANRMELNPAENPSRSFIAPHLVAENRGGHWDVSGTENPEIIQQVLDELNHNLVTGMPILLSAAP